MKIKTLTIKELRTKKPVEIEKYVVELKKSQTELIHALSTNKETKSHQISVIKKAIAQAKTILSAQVKVNAGEEK